MREGTAIYTKVPEIKTPPNCVKINANECFPGNILAPTEHGKNWLRREASHVTSYKYKYTMYIYAVYVRLSIFNPVFALNFVVSFKEHDGFTTSGQTKLNAAKEKVVSSN